MSNPASLAAAVNPAAAAVQAAQDTGIVTISAPVINATADALKSIPVAQNPLYNPAMYRTLPAQSRAAIHAAAGQVISGQPPAQRPVTVDIDSLEGIHGYESSGALDPRTGLLRVPAARLEICGAAPLTLAAAATGTLKFNPQRDFKAVRLIIPSAEEFADTTYIQNILVGNRPIYLGTGNEPVENFSELSTAALVDFPICRVGLTIAGTLINGSGSSQTFYAALLGYVTDGKAPEPLKGHLRRMAIPPQSVASAATFTYALNPQDAFKVRKFVIDQGVAASFIVSAVSIGNEPQLLSSDPVPAQGFADRAQDLWLDWDRCKTGQQIFITVTNTSGSTANFQGALLGDVDESSPF